LGAKGGERLGAVQAGGRGDRGVSILHRNKLEQKENIGNAPAIASTPRAPDPDPGSHKKRAPQRRRGGAKLVRVTLIQAIRMQPAPVCCTTSLVPDDGFVHPRPMHIPAFGLSAIDLKNPCASHFPSHFPDVSGVGPRARQRLALA